ncbi:hypothetical protein CUMW_238020, partial [Citrus unshiu]
FVCPSEYLDRRRTGGLFTVLGFDVKAKLIVHL